jgi:hypothetical protein
VIRSVQDGSETVPPQVPIAAFPSDAELYFLSNRPNPFRFCSSAIGLRTREDLEEAIAIIQREAPPLITFRPEDKCSTDATRAIMDRVRAQYDLAATIGGVEVYRLRPR